MNYKELNETLATLDVAMMNLEDTYIENEGECTPETEEMESVVSSLKTLLSTEGADMLGAWLKAKEDKKKSLKAEKDYITRKMASIDQTIDFIKAKLNEVMVATDMTKLEGSHGYSFKVTESNTTSVDKDVLKVLYKDKIDAALTMAHIPCYIGVTLTASATKFNEYGSLAEGDEEIFNTEIKPTIRFTKPRASKE